MNFVMHIDLHDNCCDFYILFIDIHLQPNLKRYKKVCIKWKHVTSKSYL